MRKLMIVCFLMLSFLFPASVFCEEGHSVIQIKPLTLHPGKKGDPYSVIIPLDLKHTGKIRISIQVEKTSKGKAKMYTMKGPFKLTLYDAAYKKVIDPTSNNIPKKYKLKYVPVMDPRKHYLEYFVDDFELVRLGGQYELFVTNMTNASFKGQYILRYPGSKEEAAASANTPQGNYPDLVVSDIYLNNRNKVVVSIQNRGTKGVPEKIWSRKGKGACQLDISLNGKYWGGAGIQVFDPEKKLMQTRSKVVFLTALTLKGSAQVTASVRPSAIRERDTKNNSRTEKLIPGSGQSQGKKYDLAVGRIFLNDQNYIVATVINKGESRLPDKLWEKKGTKACSLNLTINNRSWGGATLKGFDPLKKLQKPGGSIQYITRYKVVSPVKAAVEVDALSVIKETNERNNQRVKAFQP